jgi:hypothetical protein|tara:strand:+ start:1635 stop:1952 length:318 start_codon:yes stop_codon:yes gene_type:complete
MNKKLSELEVTSHAQVVDEWYRVMGKNNISVQPKAATILGTILAKYDLSIKKETRDIWEESLTIKGSELTDWYNNLSNTDKMKYEESRLRASEKQDSRNRSLLKG